MKTNKVSRVYKLSGKNILSGAYELRYDTRGEGDIFHLFDLPPPKFRGWSG